MNSSCKQSDSLLNEKIAAIREKNTKLENRYREVELDKKSAAESGSSILPSQIKVTIFQKASRGRSHGFSNLDYASQNFNDFCQRTQRSYRGRGGGLTNNFSKSMSRLSHDAPYGDDGSQPHRYVNPNAASHVHRGGGRRGPQQQQPQQQPPMDDRRRGRGGGSGRFNRPPVPSGGCNSGRKVRIEEDVQGLPPASRACNNPAPIVRKGPQYGNQNNGGPPRYRDLREYLNNARSMPALDDVDSYGDPRFNRHPAPPASSQYSQRRQRNSANYQNPRFNDPLASDSYGPRDSYAKRSFPVASGRHQNRRPTHEENANAPTAAQQHQVRSSSSRRQAAELGGTGQARTSVGSKASGNYVSAWPPASLPCDASGKWVRGMVRCGKHEIAVGTACENEGDNQVHVCASCGCAKVGPTPENVNPDADGLTNDEDEDLGSIESLHCASNDEYIDDNPLDDLDQFTLKIDMDGGFVVHDASICDPILQKPIRSWIDEELSDMGLDAGAADEPDPVSESAAAATAALSAAVAIHVPSEESAVTFSSSLPLSVECSIFSAAQSSSSGVSTLSSHISVGCADMPSVEPPLRRVVSAEQLDKISLNRTIGPNLSMR